MAIWYLRVTPPVSGEPGTRQTDSTNVRCGQVKGSRFNTWRTGFLNVNLPKLVAAFLCTKLFIQGGSASVMGAGPLVGNGSTLSNRPIVYLTCQRPRDYGSEGPAFFLNQRLSREETAILVNPLVRTPEMDQWALTLTSGQTNDLEKAKALYSALLKNVRFAPPRFAHAPTAEEVFSAWNIPDSSFRCEDLSFLYEALGRAVGLEVFDVDVTEDCFGGMTPHGCAAVFVGDKAVLVDLAYQWFGAPHRRFKVLDDARMIGSYLCEKGDLARCRLACKLAPDLPIVRVNLFDKLAGQELWSEAKEQIPELMRLDPNGPLTFYVRARMATHEGNLKESMRLLERGIAKAPNMYGLYDLLGYVYIQQRQWPEAREAYQNALRCSIYGKGAQLAEQAISYVNACDFYYRACQQKERGALDNSISNYTRAVEIKPDYARAYLDRGAARAATGDSERALSDYKQAVNLDPLLGTEAIPLLERLGYHEFEHRQYPVALSAFSKAQELGQGDLNAALMIWVLRCRAGDVAEAAAALRSCLYGGKKSVNDVWWQKVGRFLLGEVTEMEILEGDKGSSGDAAKSRMCQACFYAGMKSLVNGDQAAALRHLQKAVTIRADGCPEHSCALAELRRLERER